MLLFRRRYELKNIAMSCIPIVTSVKPVVPAGMGMVLARVIKSNTTPIPAVPVPATPQVYPYPCPTLITSLEHPYPDTPAHTQGAGFNTIAYSILKVS